MEYLTAGLTDIGIAKKTNQDSYCIKVAQTDFGEIVMAVVCDGMGGLSKGELASSTIIRAFAAWFEYELPPMLTLFSISDVQYSWNNLIKEQNEKLKLYGRSHRIRLGTTLSAMLIADRQFLIAQVGDSGIYQIGQQVTQLTDDQTVVDREVKIGNMTKGQARVAPNKNILLQCIGVSNIVVPDFTTGYVHPQSSYLLCSDGFRHVITEEEMGMSLRPEYLTNEVKMSTALFQMIEIIKGRQERDNITALLIRPVNY